MSECTISSGTLALTGFLAGNDYLCCLPRIYPSHTLSGFSINGKPLSMFFMCNDFNAPKFKCPNLRCHNHDSSFTTDWNTFWISLSLSFIFLALDWHASSFSEFFLTSDFVFYSLKATLSDFPLTSGLILKGDIMLLGNLSIITHSLFSI